MHESKEQYEPSDRKIRIAMGFTALKEVTIHVHLHAEKTSLIGIILPGDVYVVYCSCHCSVMALV